MTEYLLDRETELTGNLFEGELEAEEERIRGSGFMQRGLRLDCIRDESYFVFYDVEDPLLCKSDLGFLIPHHRIALVFNEAKTLSLNSNYRQHLERLGYSVSTRESSTNYARKGSKRTQFWILGESRKKGLDQRAVEILRRLGENLDLEGSSLRFASFEIGVKTFTPADYGRVIVEQEIRPKTKFLDIPFEEAVRRLNEIYKTLPLISAIGLTSRVTKQGETYHIPMLDIDQAFIQFEDIQRLGMNGMRVLSGMGEHFYGFRLLREEEFDNFLENARGAHGLDSDWVDFQTEQGFMLLRFTPSRNRLSQPCFDEMLNPQTGTRDRPYFCDEFDEFYE